MSAAASYNKNDLPQDASVEATVPGRPLDRADTQPALLQTQDLCFAYKPGSPVLKGINLEVHAGETLVLLGPNGSGKTTLLNCLAGLLKPQSGAVRLGGQDIKTMSMRQIALHLGYLPQFMSVGFEFCVLDYVVMGAAPHLHFGKSPSKSDYARAQELLEQLGVAALAEAPMSALSGGERQLAQIARILMQRSPLVLMDEPTNHLDYGNQIRALRLVKQMCAQGLAVIMTSHVPDHAIWLHSQVGVLRKGQPLLTGPASQVLDEELLSGLYQENISLHYLPQRGHCICVPELNGLNGNPAASPATELENSLVPEATGALGQELKEEVCLEKQDCTQKD